MAAPIAPRLDTTAAAIDVLTGSSCHPSYLASELVPALVQQLRLLLQDQVVSHNVYHVQLQSQPPVHGGMQSVSQTRWAGR